MVMLSIDHQNHSKWPKWGHVRYKLYNNTPTETDYSYIYIESTTYGTWNMSDDGPSCTYELGKGTLLPQ